MRRRISIVRNPGKGDVLADKALDVKLDGWKEGTLETGYRLVFDENDKAHTMTVSYTGEWNLELNHPIPAGEGDIILVLDCEKNNYTISEAEYRKLTIRRENGNTSLGLWVQIDGKNHPQAWVLDNAGDWMTVCVDTAEHTLELQGHGFFGNRDVRKVSVPAGTENVEYLVSVSDDKTVKVRKKKSPARKQQTASKPQNEPAQQQKQAPKQKQAPPAPKKKADVYGSSTTYHLKMDIKAMFRPDGGELYQWLTSGVENVFMQAMDDAVMFIGTSYAEPASPEAKGKNFFYKEINQNTDELRQMAKQTGGTFPKKVHPYNLLESDEEQETLQQILEEFIKSDQCPGITMINDEICLDPAYGIDVEDSITMSFLKGDYLKPMLYLPHGILCDAMCSQNPPAEYIDVAAGTMGISFNGHFRGMAAGKYKTVFTVLWEDINNETVLLAAEKMKGVKGHGPVITRLDAQKDRDEVIRIIRDFINEEVNVARMDGNRITLKPEVYERPQHPDMNYSLTASVLWCEMLDNFGEDSDFAAMTKKIPVTCFVTAETDRLKVTVMVEDEAGTTQVHEFKYSDCTFDKLPSSWEQLKIRDWQNRFERLDDSADQAELVDYLMWMMDVFPHIIIEGNSFRSRRKGEEIIDVGQTLTGQMMARKVVMLFDLDGEFIDIMRHSNIDSCHIAGYKDYLAFIFNDRDGKVVKTIYRDFSELVDEEFLSGEDCFDHLTCGFEKDELSYFLGKAVGNLPYMRTRSKQHLDSNILFIDKNMIPMLDEPYLPDPAPVQAPAKSEEQAVTELPEAGDFAEPEKPAFSVQTSPTTLAMVEAMKQQFAEGGAMNRFMAEAGFSGAEMMTGSHEIVIGFWKNGTCCSRISMQYVQFSKGGDCDYQVLNEEEQKALQEIIRTSVPYFDV